MFKRTPSNGFTLVELLVVIGIISILLSIILPAVGKAKEVAKTTNCLSNLRNMQIAHTLYMGANEDSFIDVGLAHGGLHSDEEVAWINTLRTYYGDDLLHRSPVDDSPYWDTPVPGSGGQLRRTSYGVNDFLTTTLPQARKFLKLSDVPRPHATVQFLIMTFGHESHEVDFAASDHIHAYLWGSHVKVVQPFRASRHVEINAHGGPETSYDSVSNYGFLDGHAETLKFEEVYESDQFNSFDPLRTR